MRWPGTQCSLATRAYMHIWEQYWVYLHTAVHLAQLHGHHFDMTSNYTVEPLLKDTSEMRTPP